MSATDPNDLTAIAEAGRTAWVQTAVAAYEDAGIQGLCDEGRWEYAVAAMRRLDLQSLNDPADTAPEPQTGRPTPREN